MRYWIVEIKKGVWLAKHPRKSTESVPWNKYPMATSSESSARRFCNRWYANAILRTHVKKGQCLNARIVERGETIKKETIKKETIDKTARKINLAERARHRMDYYCNTLGWGAPDED